MIPIKNMVITFSLMLITGLIFTLPLYRFDWKKFIKTKLFVKIVFWLPIFLVFIGILYASSHFRLLILLLIVGVAILEVLSAVKKLDRIHWVYFILFCLGLAHLVFLGASYSTRFVDILISLTFATVIADVMAFFLGNYFGIHKLPPKLNSRKSWEGVVGELLGSFLGIVIVDVFIIPVPSLWLFLPIGIGAIIGDLSNSYVKRASNIRDWSSALPGHGGFIDRLSSLAGSATLTFYYLKLFE